LDRPPDLLGVQFIKRYFGNFVLPATPRMRTFQENPLIGFGAGDEGFFDVSSLGIAVDLSQI
jgi:hypothetical protein